MRLRRKVIMRHIVSLRIDKETLDLLDKQADRLGVTRSSIVELALAMLEAADKQTLEGFKQNVKLRRRKVKARPRHVAPDIFA